MASTLPMPADPVALFRQAEASVINAGFAWEIDWQRSRTTRPFNESDFLREAAWVILCSGFREDAVRSRFDYLSLCFCDWESARAIVSNRDACIATASSGFGNHRKLEAIAGVADLVFSTGFNHVRRRVQADPIAELQTFPFIGPVTSWHLAKNLGLDVAKNDRHLARLAAKFKLPDAHALCRLIAESTGELASVVDIVLWRYCAIAPRSRSR